MIDKKTTHAALVKNHNDRMDVERAWDDSADNRDELQQRLEALNDERNELKRTCLKAMGLTDEKYDPAKYYLDYTLVEKSIYLWLTANHTDKLKLELVIDASLWTWKTHWAVMSKCKGPQSILTKLCVWFPWARKAAEIFPVHASVTVDQFLELCKINCYDAIHDYNANLIKELEKFENYQTTETRLVEPTQGK